MVIDPDYSLYPSKDYQLKWLRIYLEEKAKVQGNDTLLYLKTGWHFAIPLCFLHVYISLNIGLGHIVTQEQVEKFYVEVNKFALVSTRHNISSTTGSSRSIPRATAHHIYMLTISEI